VHYIGFISFFHWIFLRVMSKIGLFFHGEDKLSFSCHIISMIQTWNILVSKETIKTQKWWCCPNFNTSIYTLYFTQEAYKPSSKGFKKYFPIHCFPRINFGSYILCFDCSINFLIARYFHVIYWLRPGFWNVRLNSNLFLFKLSC